MIFVYVPCQDFDTAKNIAGILVEKRMAGKVDILPVQTVYSQNGGTAVASRAVMIIKTIDKHVQGIEDVVRENYHDGVPCVAVISLYRLNREFKDWLIESIS